MFSAALYAHVRNFLPIAHETAGAARIRHSLRPLFLERAGSYQQTSGAMRRENAEVRLRHPEVLAGFGEPRRMNRPRNGPRILRGAQERAPQDDGF